MQKINKTELKTLISELQDNISDVTAADVVYDSTSGSIHAVYFSPECYTSPKMPKRIDETATKKVIFVATPEAVSKGVDYNEKHFSFTQTGIQKLVDEVFA